MSDPVIIALIGFFGLIGVALLQALTLLYTRTLEKKINSRMDQIIRQAEALARAAGVKEGEARRDDPSGHA